jgi:hypothetical protein
MPGTPFVDDPFPATGRGAWFNGDIDHYTVSGLVLTHSFTLEFFVLPKLDFGSGTLYASYKSPHCWDNGSVYRFKIEDKRLTFSESPTGIKIAQKSPTVGNGTWTHVGMSVEWHRSTF